MDIWFLGNVKVYRMGRSQNCSFLRSFHMFVCYGWDLECARRWGLVGGKRIAGTCLGRMEFLGSTFLPLPASWPLGGQYPPEPWASTVMMSSLTAGLWRLSWHHGLKLLKSMSRSESFCLVFWGLLSYWWGTQCWAVRWSTGTVGYSALSSRSASDLNTQCFL